MAYRKVKRVRRQRRRPMRQKRVRRGRQAPHKKAATLIRKQRSRDKRVNLVDLGRIMQPNNVIRKFARVNIATLTPNVTPLAGQTSVYATLGGFDIDYILSSFMNQATMDYMTNQYFFMNIMGFEVTFWIQDTNSLTQVGAVLASNNLLAQSTDTSRQPFMFVLHCNSPLVQSTYFSNTTPANWLANPQTKRITQRSRAVYQWHMPMGYQPQFVATAGTLTTQTIDATFAGPTDNEPHGFAGLWKDFISYTPSATVTLAYKVTAVLQFKDRKPTSV